MPAPRIDDLPYQQCDACGHVRVRHHEACDVEGCSCPAFAEPSGEVVICGRDGALARWTSSRWGTFYGAKWPEGFTKPRTCTNCGGVDPEGATRLIEEGWEVEGTGKSYKRYLNPPGCHAARHAFIESVRDGALDDPGRAALLPRVETPIPPVKLYVAHFSEEQIARLNQAVALNRLKGEA